MRRARRYKVDFDEARVNDTPMAGQMHLVLIAR
jgi:hypothetical protein